MDSIKVYGLTLLLFVFSISGLTAQDANWGVWVAVEKDFDHGKSIWFRVKEKRVSRNSSEYIYQFKNVEGEACKAEWRIPYVGVDGKKRTEHLSANFKEGKGLVFSSQGWHFFGKPGQAFLPKVEVTYTGRFNKSATPSTSVTFETMWSDGSNDIVEGGTLHAKFKINGYKGKECFLSTNFEFSNGQKIKDLDGKNRDKNGNVLIWKMFTPTYDQTVYSDFKISFDYRDLHLKANVSHNVQYWHNVYVKENGNWKFLAQSPKKPLKINWKGSSRGATFEKADYRFNGSDLSKILLTFRHKGLKNRRCHVTIRFQMRDTKEYLQYEARQHFTPTHDPGTYTRMEVPIDISKFDLWAGSHKVEWWANFHVENGTRREHIMSTRLQPITLDIPKTASNSFLGTVRTKAKRVRIVYRDHGNEDGDRVKILHNGTVVQQNSILTNQSRSTTLTLKSGMNRVYFGALNEGRDSPNTAEFWIVDENGNSVASTRKWNLRTGQKAIIAIIKD